MVIVDGLGKKIIYDRLRAGCDRLYVYMGNSKFKKRKAMAAMLAACRETGQISTEKLHFKNHNITVRRPKRTFHAENHTVRRKVQINR